MSGGTRGRVLPLNWHRFLEHFGLLGSRGRRGRGVCRLLQLVKLHELPVLVDHSSSGTHWACHARTRLARHVPFSTSIGRLFLLPCDGGSSGSRFIRRRQFLLSFAIIHGNRLYSIHTLGRQVDVHVRTRIWGSADREPDIGRVRPSIASWSLTEGTLDSLSLEV